MTWWLIAAGVGLLVFAGVFAYALCKAAADGDRMSEAAGWRDNLEDRETARVYPLASVRDRKDDAA